MTRLNRRRRTKMKSSKMRRKTTSRMRRKKNLVLIPKYPKRLKRKPAPKKRKRLIKRKVRTGCLR